VVGVRFGPGCYALGVSASYQDKIEDVVSMGFMKTSNSTYKNISFCFFSDREKFKLLTTTAEATLSKMEKRGYKSSTQWQQPFSKDFAEQMWTAYAKDRRLEEKGLDQVSLCPRLLHA
jgi:hypothetical protein